jgi:hypothetical protein
MQSLLKKIFLFLCSSMGKIVSSVRYKALQNFLGNESNFSERERDRERERQRERERERAILICPTEQGHA